MTRKNGFNDPEVKHGDVKIIRYGSNKSEITIKPNPEFKKNKLTNKRIKKNKKKSKKKNRYKFKGDGFYKSREWKEIRYRVLRTYKAKCMCCGMTPHQYGIVIHVDHIKPRSKYPNLELCFDNMQVLCDVCNIGKSNIDNTDWRPLSNNDIYLIKQSQKMG